MCTRLPFSEVKMKRKSKRRFYSVQKKIRSMKFGNKIAAALIILILVPMILMSFFTYRSNAASLTAQTVEAFDYHMSNCLSDIDMSMSAAVTVNNSLLEEPLMIEMSDIDYAFDSEEKQYYYSQIYKLLNVYISRLRAPNILKNVKSYYIYLVSQQCVITTDSTYYEDIDADGIDFYSKLAENGFISGWYSVNPIYSGKAEDDESMISYLQPLYSESGEMYAVISLNVDSEMLSDFFDYPVADAGAATYIFRSNADRISRGGNTEAEFSEEEYAFLASCAKLSSPPQTARLGKDKYRIVTASSNYSGWETVTVIPDSGITAGLRSDRNLSILAILIGFAVVIFISIVFSRSIQRPIRKLMHGMDEVKKGNFKVKIRDNRLDDYHVLFEDFNSMTEQLDSLVNNLSTEQMLNKEAKIKLLQEQINPHFLYNTLDSIYSIAKLQNVPDIPEMVLALSRFFRESLSEGKDIVPLSDAITLVESYLTVQNIRFKGRVKFSVDAEESLLSCLVPKLILQPFVENAVYHGIEKKKGGGQLVVSALSLSGEMMLRVTDDGIGMPAEKLDQIRAALAGDDSLKGNFAMRNLNTQIKLLFGSRYGISVDSIQGVGTSVVIRLPLIRDEEELQSKTLLPVN